MNGVPGGDLLSRAKCSLSLALIRFTVLFEMGRGGSERLLPPSEGGGLLVFRSTDRIWRKVYTDFVLCDCSVLRAVINCVYLELA